VPRIYRRVLFPVRWVPPSYLPSLDQVTAFNSGPADVVVVLVLFYLLSALVTSVLHTIRS
jgi:hypothetical protein